MVSMVLFIFFHDDWLFRISDVQEESWTFIPLFINILNGVAQVTYQFGSVPIWF